MKILITIFYVLLINISFSQNKNVQISSVGDPEEPTIIVNIYDPSIILAGANIDHTYFSTDTGNTWQRVSPTSTYGVMGDPCMIVDNHGDFYYLHLSYPDNGSWIDRIVCQKSTDNGQTWNNGSYMGLNGSKKQDKEWATVDRANNNIYVTWTQFDNYGSNNPADSSTILFSKSTDAGASWSTPVRLSQTNGDCVDDDYTVEGAVPTVGKNGEIFVAWAGKKTNGDLAIMFDKSTDFGETWLDEDIVVTDFPDGWVFNIPGINRCNGLPVTVCDTSGLFFDGRIYINWTDQRNGANDTDVWLVKSDDNGITWSEPFRINDDVAGSQQFFTWITIDQITGFLYCVFYDRRNYDDNNTDVYMAVSKDGGETFENIKISESPFLPNSNKFFGDYTNISAHNGIIRPIWTRLHNEQLSIWTAIFEPSPSFINYTKNVLSVSNIYPNPFETETNFTYNLKNYSDVSLKLFDVSGKLISVVSEVNSRPPGKYVEKINANELNLKSGFYYIIFQVDSKVSTKKIVVY